MYNYGIRGGESEPNRNTRGRKEDTQSTMGRDRQINDGSLNEFLSTARQRMLDDRNRNFRVICLSSDLPWEKFLTLCRGYFSVEEQGDFYELHQTYEKHQQVFDVYLYLFRHPETGSPTFLTLNSHDGFSRTADRMIRNSEGIYYVWFPPDAMAKLTDRILAEEGTKMVGFEGKKFGRERKYEEERRPETRREGEYWADDAAETLEERKKEYGITPTHLHFEWPTNGDFHFRDEGEFVLTRGDPGFFFNEIVSPGLEDVTPLNTAIKRSHLNIVDNDGVERIDKESLEIDLNHALDYDEADAFISRMKSSGFYPYSYRAAEGSLLLNGRIVDERSGGMISISTDGQVISVLPRYDSGFDSLLRFYRFVVEEVDGDATVRGVG